VHAYKALAVQWQCCNAVAVAVAAAISGAWDAVGQNEGWPVCCAATEWGPKEEVCVAGCAPSMQPAHAISYAQCMQPPSCMGLFLEARVP